MAEETKNLLYSVKIDLSETTKALNEYAAAVEATKKAQAEGGAATEEAADRQVKAAKKTKEVVDAEAGSIRALREENKRLTEARNNTSTATEQGKIKIAELNKKLDENNALIKQNVDQYTKQKIGVGDYSGALDKLVPGLAATANGIWGTVKASLAFIATPIGAVIGALGAAIGALTAYFKSSTEAENQLNKITSVLGALMEKVMDIVEGVGEAIYNAFTNPKQALIDLYEFVKQNLINRFTAFSVILDGIVNLDFEKTANGVLQLGTGVEDVIGKVTKLAEDLTATFNKAIEQGRVLAILNERITKEENELIVSRAQTALEVAKLKEKAISQEGDAKRKTIEEAIALEKKLADAELAHAKVKFNTLTYEINLKGTSIENDKLLAQAEADYIAAQAQRYEATLRFQKQLESLNDAEAKRKEKEAADKKKAEEDEDKRILDAQDAAWKEQQINDKKRYDKEEKDKKVAADKEVSVEKIKSSAVTGLVQKTLGDKVDAQKVYTSLFKKNAAKETWINTKAAMEASYKSLAGIPIIGPVLGVIAAAASLAFGLEQISGINAVAFAKGGKALSGTKINANHGIPIQRSNGDNLLATVAIGEAIVNKEQQRRLGGDAAFRRAGVPGFYGGGVAMQVESRIASDSVDQNSMLSVVDAAIRAIQPTLVLQDFEAKQLSKNQVEARSKVI